MDNQEIGPKPESWEMQENTMPYLTNVPLEKQTLDIFEVFQV